MVAMKTIDFTRPTKFTPDHERRLGRALAAFCRTSSTRLSAELRLPIELDFVEGNCVAVDGKKLSPANVLRTLNKLGGKHGIGRVDLVENRFVGIKSRGCYETPGGTLIVAAHRELEALTLDRDLSHHKQHIALRYADLVYNGLWFTPLREAFDAFVQKTQENVTGTVTLSLYKGNLNIVSRASALSLYSTDLSSFTMGESYDQKDAKGFIQILGLPARTRARLLQKQKEVVK